MLRRALDFLEAARTLGAGGFPGRYAAYFAQESAVQSLVMARVSMGEPGRYIAALSRFTVETLYPSDAPEISVEEAGKAVGTAEAVLAAVRAHVGA